MARKQSRRSAATGSAWNLNDPAHNQTWMLLFMTREIVTSFPDSEHITMPQMAWWNPAASPAVRRIDAEKKSIEIYRFFADAMKRPFETAYQQDPFGKAIPALADVLVDQKSRVPDIANTVDSIFRFDGETDGGDA